MKAVQVETAHAASGLGLHDPAEKVAVTVNSVARTENGGDAEPSTVEATRRATRISSGIGGVVIISGTGGAEGTAEGRVGGRLRLSIHPLAVGATALSMSTAVSAMGGSSSRAEGSHATVAAPSGYVVTTVHAVNAQIHGCEPDGHGSLAWDFWDPIATLLRDGKTIGRLFAWPS